MNFGVVLAPVFATCVMGLVVAAVVWGRLPNGLRHAIRPGGTPEDRVSLRLLVEAGSLMETEQQRGLAHFLEHMAFEGSQNLAPGELVAFLQRAGLAFGPDTNASTTFDQTIYQLDLPRDDPQIKALINDALKKVRQSGRFQELVERYFPVRIY